MDLLTLLAQVKDIVGHGHVRWDADENGEIRLYTGLTARDEDGTVNPDFFDDLRQTKATREFAEMGE